ncbi:aldehyde dehydrogenase [Tamlana sp. s12]|uniref:aldehyde dehydrogenase n=1 Tax=Tamlana sp. s12 TaxID=1630406 RepID=UPI0007FE24B7|nr:aldehyde dehydrogenase [Tamlana sp. s12]OBQ54617.1 aldehyde dehydrogenase [Tamlana sp. s12]QQY82109.1 aldehyde dehydrogenase [Tamlana sp. s12]
MDINKLLKQQQAFFNSNSTKNIAFRIEQLKKIESLLRSNEALLYEAIYEDFGKSEFETYVTELALVYHELANFIKNIGKWSKKQSVSTGFVNWPGKSYVIPEPLGNVLVIGAWNYPYQLSLLPAITALAAGNTVVLKPSELPKKTSEVMVNLINNNFPSDYFCVVEGGVEETTALLKHCFDKIFFTGSTAVGKIIYKAAAENLTPVTLELGGKSPTFVMADADIKMTAKRMVWAKFLNAGQTCVAPDYVLVEKAIETELLEAIKAEITKHYNSDSIEDNYLQIINTANYERLVKLLNTDNIYFGGQTNSENRFISPSILHQVTFEDEVMQDEIFGPILPVIAFTNLDDAIKKVKERPKPLSCYIYSKNKKTINKILHEVSFGGGAVNDSLMHLSNSHLPFGGVGLSGIGAYHGKTGFDTFTHQKSILQKPFWLEPNLKYAPYSDFKLKIIKWLMG